MNMSDKASITFIPTTQQFRFNIETSGERIEFVENNMKDAVISMVNQYFKNIEIGVYNVYKLLLTESAETTKETQWNWWETNKGVYGKLNKKEKSAIIIQKVPVNRLSGTNKST